jgi:hypothetical protein
MSFRQAVIDVLAPHEMSEIKATQELLPEVLCDSLEHIETHGNLLLFAPDRPQRLGMMKVLGKQGLVAWNKGEAKYQLTPLGRQFLDDSRSQNDVWAPKSARA